MSLTSPRRPARPSRRPTEDSGYHVAEGIRPGKTDLRSAPAAEPEQPQDQPVHKLDASGAPVSALDEKIEKAEESLEQIRPEMSGELMSITMESALKEGRPPLQIEKKVTPAPEGAKEKEEKKDEDAVTE